MMSLKGMRLRMAISRPQVYRNAGGCRERTARKFAIVSS